MSMATEKRRNLEQRLLRVMGSRDGWWSTPDLIEAAGRAYNRRNVSWICRHFIKLGWADYQPSSRWVNVAEYSLTEEGRREAESLEDVGDIHFRVLADLAKDLEWRTAWEVAEDIGSDPETTASTLAMLNRKALVSASDSSFAVTRRGLAALEARP